MSLRCKDCFKCSCICLSECDTYCECHPDYLEMYIIDRDSGAY